MEITESELRKIVFETVREHGAVEARAILMERLDHDLDFMLAASEYGRAFVQAIAEAQGVHTH